MDEIQRTKKEPNFTISESSAKNAKVELNANDFILDKHGYVIGVKSTVSKSKKESMMGYF